MRTLLHVPALAFFAVLACARGARAEVPPSRFGILPTVGAGTAVLTTPGPLPQVIGFTTLGGELFGQLTRWGLFARFDFLSSGNGGRWTAYEGSLGASYRLFGDAESFALFARGGLVYERWVATDKGCSILFFVPNTCNTLGQSITTVTADAIGVSAGARLEMPFHDFYLALGASFVPVMSLDSATGPTPDPSAGLEPGAVFQLRIDLEAGFRDQRTERKARHDQNEHRTMTQ